MKKTELNGIIDILDGCIQRTTEDEASEAYARLITARLMAEQTLMLAAILATLQNLAAGLDVSTDAIVGAIVQRTWPGVIKFDAADEPPDEEDDDE